MENFVNIPIEPNEAASPKRHSKTWETMMRYKGTVTVNDRSLFL